MKDVSDRFVRDALGAPVGEAPIPGNTRDRWGQRLALGNGQPTLKQLVATKTYPEPLPWAAMFRFSTDGVTFTPAVPAGFGGGELRINVIKGIDQQSSPATEEIVLVAGDTMPFCNLIAQSLQISARLTVEGPASLWVECVVAIVTSVDCADVVGPAAAATTIKPFTDGSATRIAAVAATTTLVPANTNRAYFSVVNQSNANLFIRLGNGVDTTPGSEQATIILPPTSFGGYEVLNYTGIVTMKFDADDAAGYALYTEGIY